MASQFQNRLVGTVVLVALGVILLPILLDGNKKHYEEQFAAIPLIPKIGDERDLEALPPITESLPAPAFAEPEHSNSEQIEVPEIGPQPMEGQRRTNLAVDTGPEKEAAVIASEIKKGKSAQEQLKVVEERITDKSPQQKKEERPPQGKAYVVQLGALKNAAKVNEIVAQLRLSGYPVYTIPSTPVAGSVTRIYVGPDISRAKLQSQIAELQQLSGLSGQVRNYTTQ